MEAASENPGKQKRGRPAAFSPECMSLVASLFPDIQTTHGRIDRCYALQALEVLRKEPGLEWLWGPGTLGESERGGGKLRFSVLTELGRIADPQEMKAVASVICGLNLGDKEAASKIKNYRRTMRLPPSFREALIQESTQQHEADDVDGPIRPDASPAALERTKLAWKHLSRSERRRFLNWLRRRPKRRPGSDPRK